MCMHVCVSVSVCVAHIVNNEDALLESDIFMNALFNMQLQLF